MINCIRYVLKGRPLSDITKDPDALKQAMILCKFSAILRQKKKPRKLEEIKKSEINVSVWKEGQERESKRKLRRADCFVYLISRLQLNSCLLYTSPSPRDLSTYRMPSSA